MCVYKVSKVYKQVEQTYYRCEETIDEGRLDKTPQSRDQPKSRTGIAAGADLQIASQRIPILFTPYLILVSQTFLRLPGW